MKCCTCTIILSVPSTGCIPNLDMAKTGRTDLHLRALGTTAAGEDSEIWQGFALTKHHCCSVLTNPLSFLCTMAAAPDLQTSHQDFSPHWNHTSIRSTGRVWVNSASQLFYALLSSILPRKEFRLFVLSKKCHLLKASRTSLLMNESSSSWRPLRLPKGSTGIINS